jgi:antitoxin component of MazEF toxin-antitoxin module
MITISKVLCKNNQGYLFLFIPKLAQKALNLKAGDLAKLEIRKRKLIITIAKGSER